MANSLNQNPRFIDTVGATSTITKESVRLIQWVDDNADIANGSNLIMTINGQAIEATVQIPTTAGFSPGAVFWQIGPFNPGMTMTLTVDTLSAGNVLVWVD